MAAEETIVPAGPVSAGPVPTDPPRLSRRAEILAVAVDLFAARGYHGVSMDDIGTAAGVTGPALYHHFAGKEAMLAAAIAPVSEELLAGGRDRVAEAVDARGALAALVDFHVAFALDNPAVITLQLHELARLPDDSRRTIRRLQRLYVEEWVRVLVAARPELTPSQARVAAHAAFGLMNSTPFIGSDLDRDAVSALLRRMTMNALLG
ncbi:MAG TPA: TetR/AcrR family transcriptional regulator [Cryptosporangiaceae bacterium]|nr:TetR/AcrR family transcriptional regulator [Cryptosporangiaceae bacterium]